MKSNSVEFYPKLINYGVYRKQKCPLKGECAGEFMLPVNGYWTFCYQCYECLKYNNKDLFHKWTI